MPTVTLKQLLEAGVHFGHQTSRWNPKMRQYIFTARNGIHIVDLVQTVKLLDDVCEWVTRTVADGGSLLFVGTKKQAQSIIEEEAARSGQHWVNHRWMGGMLTNFTIMQQRFRRMEELRQLRDSGGFESLAKKDAAALDDELGRLERNFGGMARMKRLPSAVYVVDPRKENIAVTEARKLGVPVIAITDTNCDPDLIDWVIPGNDDAIRAVRLITGRIAEACLAGRAARAERGEELEEITPPPSETAAPAPRVEVEEEEREVSIPGVTEEELAMAPAAVDDSLEESEGEAKPAPIFAEEEFERELRGLDEQDKMMGDA